MIIEFHSLQLRLDKRLTAYIKARTRQKGTMVNLIGSSMQHKGDRRSFQAVDGEIKELEYEKVESTISVPSVDIPDLKLQDIVTKAEGIAGD